MGRDFGDCAGFFIMYFSPLYAITCALSLAVVIMAKRLLMGTRVVGQHSWDTSSYCQRWQMFLCAEEIRRGTSFGGRGILDFFRGSVYLVAYFRALGAKIGFNVCM